MKNKIITFTFTIYLVLFAVLHIALPDKSMSTTERRELRTFPEFSFSSEYITKVEKYLLDHFPYREKYRMVKATFNYNVLNRLENNNIYLKEDNIYKSNYPTNVNSINNFKNKITKLNSLLTKDNKTYMMIVPDKNYYLEDNNFLHIDYDYIYSEVGKLNIKNIDIKNILNKEDYYETDTHWKQENIEKVVYELSKVMNLKYKKQIYTKHEYDNFYGVYYGESAVTRSPETLTYMTINIIDNANVKYLENSKLKKIYNEDKLDSFDSYEVYLDGASSFIEITNPNSLNEKELIIFRDSFGSSITPLLIPYYSKITLIDNRYINSATFMNYITFEDQDVLFLYSTLLVNDSGSLKG